MLIHSRIYYGIHILWKIVATISSTMVSCLYLFLCLFFITFVHAKEDDEQQKKVSDFAQYRLNILLKSFRLSLLRQFFFFVCVFVLKREKMRKIIYSPISLM